MIPGCFEYEYRFTEYEYETESKMWVMTRYEAGWGTLDSVQPTIRSGTKIFNSSHGINTKLRIPPLPTDWTDRSLLLRAGRDRQSCGKALQGRTDVVFVEMHVEQAERVLIRKRGLERLFQIAFSKDFKAPAGTQ